MSKKRILKKGFAILTVLSMMVGITVNVSAATYTTTTEYDFNDLTRVKVTSQITGADVNDQITYLAYDQSRGSETEKEPDGKYKPVGGEGSNIIYIDQKATGESPDSSDACTFSFITEVSKIGTTVVKFGAQNTTPITADSGADSINSKKYNLVTVLDGTPSGPVEISALDGMNTFTINNISGKIIKKITYGVMGTEKEVPTSQIIIGTSGSSFTILDLVDENTITVEYINRGTSTPGITDGSSYGKPVFDAGVGNTIATFSTVTFDDTDTVHTYEYGILFSENPDPKFDATSNWTGNVANNLSNNGVIKYKALGKSTNGEFAVKLVDGGSGYLMAGKPYYTRTYLVIDGDYGNTGGTNVEYGKVTTFNQ